MAKCILQNIGNVYKKTQFSYLLPQKNDTSNLIATVNIL